MRVLLSQAVLQAKKDSQSMFRSLLHAALLAVRRSLSLSAAATSHRPTHCPISKEHQLSTD